MIDLPPGSAAIPTPVHRVWWLAVFAVWAVLCVTGWRAVPDENEPHYIGKLYHFWWPDWCTGDLFLESANAHEFFYRVCGWPSLWLDLEAFTTIGRLAQWFVLAIAWTRLWSVLRFPLATAPVGMLGFVAATRYGHLAGEWVVGGFEAKVWSYALVWLGLADWIERRWQPAMLWLGLATLVHVIVGGWWTIVILLASWSQSPSPRDLLRRPWGLAVGAFCMAMALYLALKIDAGANAALRAEAHRLYVFERLPHHLVPWRVSEPRIAAHAMLVVLWLCLRSHATRSGPLRVIDRIAWVSLAIALVGVLIGSLALVDFHWSAALLRFYWLRLTDVALPLALVVALAANLTDVAARGGLRWRMAWAVTLLGFVLATVDTAQRWTNPLPAAAGDTFAGKWADWKAACAWIQENSEPETCFITPRFSQSFKWYAHRPEVATWKDLPQDVSSIVAWWERLRSIHGRSESDTSDPQQWHRALTDVPIPQLQQAARAYGASALITKVFPPLALPVLYQNNSYAVYRLDPMAAEQPDGGR